MLLNATYTFLEFEKNEAATFSPYRQNFLFLSVIIIFPIPDFFLICFSLILQFFFSLSTRNVSNRLFPMFSAQWLQQWSDGIQLDHEATIGTQQLGTNTIIDVIKKLLFLKNFLGSLLLSQLVHTRKVPSIVIMVKQLINCLWCQSRIWSR